MSLTRTPLWLELASEFMGYLALDINQLDESVINDLGGVDAEADDWKETLEE